MGTVYSFTAIKVDSRLWIAHVEGDRSTSHASQLIKHIENCRNHDTDHPLFASDRLQAFQTAIVEEYSREEPVPGLALKGNIKTHRVLPDSLGYVRIRKIRSGNHVVRVDQQIVFGAPAIIKARLHAHGTGTIQTAYVERLNGTIRDSLVRFVRKTRCFSKLLTRHSASLDLLQAWYNFVKPHLSLRLPSSQTHRKWDYQTPAMMEGLTDHVWTLKELFSFRVPIP